LQKSTPINDKIKIDANDSIKIKSRRPKNRFLINKKIKCRYEINQPKYFLEWSFEDAPQGSIIYNHIIIIIMFATMYCVNKSAEFHMIYYV
jgi:hypothetical protein